MGVRLICFIYDLSDPRTGEVRYVGKSVRPRERLATHIREARAGSIVHCKRWIAGLLAEGLAPVLGIIEETTRESANEAERYWIGCLLTAGSTLTNRTPGGDGQHAGYKPSAEVLAKLSAATKGRKATPEQRQRLREAFTRPEVSERRSQLLKERHADPEKSRAITGPTKGMKLSEETKRRMSASWTPERKARLAAEKSALPCDERWRAQLDAARAARWARYRAERDSLNPKEPPCSA
jgi:hypothetical protein